ncbi:MAG: hypothetical protein LBI82_05660 [Dysgonamonadaceae bacterium]|nr:hypothetical protein [Dysgonamonadaceae bacterium]
MLATILLQAQVIVEPNNVQDIFNTGIMDAVLEWKNSRAITYSSTLVDFGRLLCSFFALIWCAVKLYPVIAGEDKLSVLPLLRPFAIALLLMWWTDFVYICNLPGLGVESVAKAEFDNSWTNMRANAQTRFNLVDAHARKAMQMSTLAARAEDSERNALMQSSDISKDMSGAIFGLPKAIAGMAIVVMNGIKQALYGIINYLALMFMNTVVCGVLLMQAAGLLIMGIIGPLSFAFSCLDPWRHSWSQWVARFISISLWSGFAYFVCFVGAEIMNSVLEAEITVLQAQLEMEEWRFALFTSMFSSDNFMFTVICLFVAFGMIVVFPVSTWVVQTSGGAALLQPVVAAAGIAFTAVKGAVSGGR